MVAQVTTGPTVTPREKIVAFAAVLATGASIAEAAKTSGLGLSTAYRLLKRWDVQMEIDRARGVAHDITAKSHRDRVAVTIATQGPLTDVAAVIRQTAEGGETWDFNRTVETIWSLQRAGLVAFRQTKDGLTHIRALPALYRRLGMPDKTLAVEVGHGHGRPRHKTDRTDYRTHGSTAEGGPVEIAEAPEPPASQDAPGQGAEPEPEVAHDATPTPAGVSVVPSASQGYPILASIRERAGRAARAEEAARLIEAAADLLDGAYRDALLSTGLDALNAEALTPVEEEYLRFAAEKEA